MEEEYGDIGEGMSIKLTKDAEYTIRNNETGKERTFVSSSQCLLVDDEDIDYDLIKKEYGRDTVDDKSARYNFYRVDDFKNGECRLKWVIYPDGRYFADSDGYGAEDNNEESAICIINRDLEIIAPFRPPKYVGKEEAETLEIEEDLDISVLPMSSDEDKYILRGFEPKYIDVEGLLKTMEDCRQKLDEGIRYMRNDLDLKPFESNVLAIKIGKLYALINTRNGSSRVLINDKGEILIDLPEELEETPKDDSYMIMGDFEASDVSLKCIHVTKSGLSIIKIKKETYDYSIDGYFDIDSNYVDLSYGNEVSVVNPLYYCILDQKLEVLIPVSELTEEKKSCNPELIPDAEWEKIWSKQL